MNYLTVFGIVCIYLGFSNSNTDEFEGRISFKVNFEIKDSRVSKKDLEKFYGTDKEYFFKSGMYKWVSKNGNLSFELYNYDIDSVHTISKRNNNDTLYYNDFTKSFDKLLSIDSVGVETICNIKCQVLKFNMTDRENKIITRTIYFPIDTLLYSKDYYKSQKGMCNDLIHSYGGSIPLKLILDIDGVPFKLIYTATKIHPSKIDESVFQINDNNPKKYR